MGNNMNCTKMTNKFFNIVVIIVTALALIYALVINHTEDSDVKGHYSVKVYEDYSVEVYEDYSKLHYAAAKDALVTAVDNYIKDIAPGSALNGLAVVEGALEYGVDIKFILAQGQIESHFGTTGLARRTNGVFNILAYDGLNSSQIIKKGGGYKHPDYSVRPYLKLLVEKYFVDGKTEKDMFHKFVNKEGKRYASNPKYETQMFNTYMKIDSLTNISELEAIFRKCKIISEI